MLTYFLEGKANGNNSQTRSLNLERKMYPYGRANIQTKLGTSCPSMSSSPSLSTNTGAGTLQVPSTHTNLTLHYLPSVPAVKETWEQWKWWLCHLQRMWRPEVTWILTRKLKSYRMRYQPRISTIQPKRIWDPHMWTHGVKQIRASNSVRKNLLLIFWRYGVFYWQF